jgi:3-hydroxyisobutyrate dehydrogenase
MGYILQGICPGAPASNDYKGGFSSALMLKDLRLALQLAASKGQPVPMGEKASQLYQQVRE